ncbi:MAG: hypothetical protein Q9183_004622, partial [Haloplaca sp. 2 TL-2023]
MSSPEFSTPPSKKRKITTTYGSRSAISRAVQAVKDAVPGKLLFLANGARTERTVEQITADSLVSTQYQDGMNAVIEDSDDSGHDDEHSRPDSKYERHYTPEDTPRSTRSSKRSLNHSETLDEGWPKKKRRKATPEAREANGAKSTTAI